ncbi:MAG: hypothetical protein LC713_03125, partial [Actinobacteria bacterium]|nr:hypothetical protein [Actinomycetota bacterium]
QHTIEVTVADGTVAGGTTRRSWDVFVVAVDGDGDGWTATTDCDDANFAVHRGANELLGNDVDDDCDPGTPDAPPGGLTGSIWSWGANRFGQIGNGTTTQYDIPSPLRLPGHDDVVQVSSGGGSNYAVRATGNVLSWGTNEAGQLGTGNFDPSSAPVSPVPVGGGSGELSGIASLDAGLDAVLARRTDGSVVAWGLNAYRQLGDGSTVDSRNHPVDVLAGPGGPPLAGVRSVEAGYLDSYAVMDDGTARSWGIQRCNGGPIVPQPFPTPMSLVGSGVRQLSAGPQWLLVLKNDGTVLSCGNDAAESGRPFDPAQPFNAPFPVTGLGPGSGVVAVSAGGSTGLALKEDSSVWAWGRNLNHELDALGVPLGEQVRTPQRLPLPAGPPVVAIDTDMGCATLAIRADGSVLSWGCND